MHSCVGAEYSTSSKRDDGFEKDFFDDESSDEDTIAEPVQFKDSPIAVPLNYVTGEYGQGRLIKTRSPDSLHSIPYPVFYRYRGKELKGLSRYEYYSLVQVKRREKESDADKGKNRPKTKELLFGKGLNEAIGGDGSGRWYQYLRSKHCTPQFFSSPARPPGSKPSDPEKEKVWRMMADKFACDYLIMFRPETELYEEGQSCKYEYNWEAFENFILELKMSGTNIGWSRLDQIERMMHSWGVNEEKKNVLTEWRGRNRTLWSAGDKELASAEYAKFKRGKLGDEDDNETYYDYHGGPSEKLTPHQTNIASNMISHSRELLTELNKLHGAPRDEERGAARGPAEPVRTIKFNEEFAKSLPKLQPGDNDDNDPSSGRDVPGSAEAKVDAYLEDEDLSSDKTPVIQVVREHYRAVCDGRSQDERYNAPLLLVCGGPGNGKSKLVETLDGVASLMDAGTQVKTAFLGVAAVNIGGSSLCSLFDIPTERRSRKDGPDIKKVILPWSYEKKKRFIKMYDIEKMSCIVVDEISTLHPYMLAYLSARLMELLPESGKDFGGIAVILCGDFDQLPPVGGVGNLAAATMKYEEALNGSDSNITRWDLNKHCINVHNEGLRLSQKATCFQLTQQHRSKDPAHTEIIDEMRRSGKVNMFDLKHKCKLLQKEDVEGDGDFRFATTLVTGNEERHKINNLKAKDWVSHRNTFLVRWLRKVNYRDWKGKPSSKENINHAMSNNETFYELFVQGARGFLNHNINTDIGLANGTEIKYHSISFDDPDDERDYRKQMKSRSPGEMITLHQPPSAINVELFADFPGDSAVQKKKNATKRRNWQHGSLAKDSRIVIPISTKYASYNEWEQTYVPPAYSTSRSKSTGLTRRSWCPIYSLSKVPLRDYFCIEPGFCITLHKAQGRTIRRLVISISDHPYHKLRHKWEGLYVGLSRVEYNEHMRLLLKRGDWGTTKCLRALERCKYGECFFKGYARQPNQNGMRWNRQLAIVAAKEANLFKENKTGKAKRRVKKRQA